MAFSSRVIIGNKSIEKNKALADRQAFVSGNLAGYLEATRMEGLKVRAAYAVDTRPGSHHFLASSTVHSRPIAAHAQCPVVGRGQSGKDLGVDTGYPPTPPTPATPTFVQPYTQRQKTCAFRTESHLKRLPTRPFSDKTCTWGSPVIPSHSPSSHEVYREVSR